MSQNCPTYKQNLENWRSSLQKIQALQKQFLATGGLKLKEQFYELKKELEANKKQFLDFAYEEIEMVGFDETKPRIQLDLENITENLDENTPWETIERLSKIPGITSNLTKIKQEYKDRITHWAGDIIDYSQDVSYEKLETVGGVLYAPEATTFSANALETVGWSLYANSAQTFSANALETVGGSLDAQNAQTFSAIQLANVNEIYLTKEKFQEFWDENGNFDWQAAFNAGRLVIDVSMRDKVEWR